MEIIDRYRFSTILVTSIIMFGLVIGCGRPVSTAPPLSSEDKDTRQQIIEYLKEMEPTMEAHVYVHEDIAKLTSASNPDYNDTLSDLRNLFRRMETIYIEVEASVPPPVLSGYKGKWSKECQLTILALSHIIEGMVEHDVEVARKGDERIFEANDLRGEYIRELIEILQKYNIDVPGM